MISTAQVSAEGARAAASAEDSACLWQRPQDCPDLVWHRFEGDDWVVHDPGLGTTHALGVLPSAVLTMLEAEALSPVELRAVLGVADADAAAVAQALLELEARGLIERV